MVFFKGVAPGSHSTLPGGPMNMGGTNWIWMMISKDKREMPQSWRGWRGKGWILKEGWVLGKLGEGVTDGYDENRGLYKILK